MKSPFAWCVTAALLVAWMSSAEATQPKELARPGFDLEQRIACQATLEDLKWSYTLWPESNPSPKPERSAIISDAAIRTKVETSLRRETALFALYGIRITTEALQRELNRMTRNTRASDRLHEIYAVLDNDATSVGECVARPYLTEQALRMAYDDAPGLGADSQGERDFNSWWDEQHSRWNEAATSANPEPLSFPARNDDSGTSSLTNPEALAHSLEESRYGHVAVWTGSEMIIWGGRVVDFGLTITGSRYNPASDTWIPIETAGAPTERMQATVVWTGVHMIVWGGEGSSSAGLNTGGAYNPALDVWTPTSTTGSSPSARRYHTAIWSGSEMIVWGGFTNAYDTTASGGRYNPTTNTWVSTALPPSAWEMPRMYHTAIWADFEMIIWGGLKFDNTPGYSGVNTGARYRPSSNTWEIIPTINAPAARVLHTAIWSGSEMVIWGGVKNQNGAISGFSTGGRYHPLSNIWRSTTIVGAPLVNSTTSAAPPLSVWTGNEMIVWFGEHSGQGLGGRYDPNSDVWGPMPTTVTPRNDATAVWSGSEMIVYGFNGNQRYRPATNSWTTGASVPFPVVIFLDGFE